MAGLFSNNPETKEGKYLVKRRDGTVPQWPFFVIAASDPHSIPALLAYAKSAEEAGLDPTYIRDLREMAKEFRDWRCTNGPGDPDAPRHRKDDPATVSEMAKGGGA